MGGIEQLTNLKTLNMNTCPKLTRLPDSTGNLQSLAPVSVEKCEQRISSPESFVEMHPSDINDVILYNYHVRQGLLNRLGWHKRHSEMTDMNIETTSSSSLTVLSVHHCEELIGNPEWLVGALFQYPLCWESLIANKIYQAQSR